MKHKFVIALSFILIFSFAFSQNKKEQIKILNLRIDSLNQNINSKKSQINNKNTVILDLENQIQNLKKITDQKKLEESIIKKTLLEKDIQLDEKNNEINMLTNNLNRLKDSILSLNLKLDTVIWEINELLWNQSEFNIKLVLPIAKFEKPFGHFLVSRDKKIKIQFDYNYTDSGEEAPSFYEQQDAINYYSKGLHNIEISATDNFSIKGKNEANELIYIKGVYDYFESMSGNDIGEPRWLWSNTIILKVIVNEKNITDYNYISDLLNRTFNSNSIFYK
jgi:hypothetical protein